MVGVAALVSERVVLRVRDCDGEGNDVREGVEERDATRVEEAVVR